MDIKPKRWLGCGCSLIGGDSVVHFRCEDHSSVEYLFATLFFLPIIPLGCYRVNEDTEKVLGEEKWKAGEVLFIYFIYLAIPVAFILYVTL